MDRFDLKAMHFTRVNFWKTYGYPIHLGSSQNCWTSKNGPSKTIKKKYEVYWYLGRIPIFLVCFFSSSASQRKTLPSTLICLQIGMFNCHLWRPKGTFWEYPRPSKYPTERVEYQDVGVRYQTWLVVTGCHFVFSHIFGNLIIPIDFHFFRGAETTNQI